MTTNPSEVTNALPGRPPLVDLATWQAARDEPLNHERANTHEGDAIRPRRSVGGQPRGPARAWRSPRGIPGPEPPSVLVLALGRRWSRHLETPSRPVPQWTRPGVTPVETLGRHGHHH